MSSRRTKSSPLARTAIRSLKFPSFVKAKLSLHASIITMLASAALTITAAPPASAQLGGTTSNPTPMPTTTVAQTQLIEWDLPAEGDATPGAVAVDKFGSNNGIWFVTRDGVPRVIRLQPHKIAKYGNAQWTSWQLDELGFITGGVRRLKPSHDRRFVFVRTLTSLQRVDTASCTTDPVAGMTSCDRISFDDSGACITNTVTGSTTCTPNAAMISDLTLDGKNNVYTAVSFDVLDPTNNFIEKLVPELFPDPGSSTGYAANVTRWQVGGGAGNCVSASSNPCLAGISTHPKNSSLVYYSEPDANNIGELNTTSSTVRRWSLTAASVDPVFGAQGLVSQPRQLIVDDDGIVWVVTGSGDLVSLNPRTNRMTRHQVPLSDLNDLFGVAPDGGNMIGYTASGLNKVAMVRPADTAAVVSPLTCSTSTTQTNCPAPKTTTKIPATPGQAVKDSGSVCPKPKTVDTTITSKSDGTFVEAMIDASSDATKPSDSTKPLGITPHPGKAVGTFFYAVGQTTNMTIVRVGFARLPRKGLKGKHEREDKDCDDDGAGRDDEDHDGIPDRHKTGDSQAKMNRENDQLGPGQTSDYTVTTGPNTLAVIAAVQADNPLAPVSVQVFDPNGISLALPVATPGLALATVVPTSAGNYTIRIKNEGPLPINHETQLITREPLSLLP
jgi:hypothetical protein